MNPLISSVVTVLMLTIGALAQQLDGPTTATVTTNVNFTDCGSSAHILELTINPCPVYKDRSLGNGCLLRRGTNVAFTLRFMPSTDETSVTHEAYGEVLVGNVKFRDLTADACPSIAGGCPITANHEVSYSNTIAINRSWPAFRVPVTYYVKGDNGTSLVCFRMAAKLS